MGQVNHMGTGLRSSASRMMFFATRSDLEALIREVEVRRVLKYVRAGLRPSPELETYESGLNLPSLGTASTGDALQEPAYLVFDASDTPRAQPIPQRRGGVRYGVYPDANPRTVMFRPGGRYDERHLISGEVVTGGEDPVALEICELFESVMSRMFRRLKSYRLGSEAARELDRGVRLTRAVGAPVAYDLRR